MKLVLWRTFVVLMSVLATFWAALTFYAFLNAGLGIISGITLIGVLSLLTIRVIIPSFKS